MLRLKRKQRYSPSGMEESGEAVKSIGLLSFSHSARREQSESFCCTWHKGNVRRPLEIRPDSPRFVFCNSNRVHRIQACLLHHTPVANALCHLSISPLLHQRLQYPMECIHDLFYANHHQVVQVHKTQSEWQAWKKVLSTALFIELL